MGPQDLMCWFSLSRQDSYSIAWEFTREFIEPRQNDKILRLGEPYKDKTLQAFRTLAYCSGPGWELWVLQANERQARHTWRDIVAV